MLWVRSLVFLWIQRAESGERETVVRLGNAGAEVHVVKPNAKSWSGNSGSGTLWACKTD